MGNGAQHASSQFRPGGGASGANCVVTSHALKWSETAKQHATHNTQQHNNTTSQQQQQQQQHTTTTHNNNTQQQPTTNNQQQYTLGGFVLTGEELPPHVEACSHPSRRPKPIPAIPPYVVKTPHLHGAPTTEETSFVQP